MEKVLVSACLIGINCKWNGRNNTRDKVMSLSQKVELVPFCSEQLGGMPTPRIPSERVGDKVLNQVELDVTRFFEEGAQKALEIAIKNNCKYAILKDHSPSCGTKLIYDGTFSRKLIEGKGYTAELLESHGIKTFSEEEVDKLLEVLD